MQIKTERLAYWYFRLNGFLNIENFIVHQELENVNHITDIDFLGVRFNHRKELFNLENEHYLKDDENSDLFKYYSKSEFKGKIYVILAEVKHGEPRINNSWLENENSITNLLYALGIISLYRIKKYAMKLQKSGYVSINRFFISIVSVGNNNQGRLIPFQNIPVISWDDILGFIYNRVQENRTLKRNMHEWGIDSEGRELFRLASSSQYLEEFKNNIEIIS